MSTIKVELEFSYLEATKGTKKFKEVTDLGETPGMGVIYLKNEFWEKLGRPEGFTMTIETD